MKGLLFHQNFEIRMEVEGEEFRQDDAIPCTLSIKNRGESTLPLASTVFALAKGDAKKVKAKAENAFEILAQAEVEEFGSLDSGATVKTSWTFTPGKNCLLTDKSQSLYVLYGIGDAPESRAHLQLSLLAHEELEGIIGIFETSFQFLLKSVKSKKDWVTAVLKGPDGPGYRALNQLELRLRFNEENKVEMHYIFKVEKLEASAMTLEVQKTKVERKEELERNDYMSSAGYVDPERLEPRIREALSQVTSRFE